MHPQAATPTRSSFFSRRELFCQHFAAGAGGAEAVRRSGYSPNGAKQRAHVLLTQPEIRLRIEALRAERRAEHQRHLADAIEVVNGVIADAAQHSKPGVVLRAVELKLKLQGVIRDKRIDFYSYDTPSPDADLENVECNRGEEFDGLPGHEYMFVPPGFGEPVPAAPAPAAPPTEIVTKDDPDAVIDATPAPATPAPGTPVRIAPRARNIPRTSEIVTSDDLPTTSLNDLIAGLAAMTAAFPPECHRSSTLLSFAMPVPG
jgi:phage terminase small subunit